MMHGNYSGFTINNYMSNYANFIFNNYNYNYNYNYNTLYNHYIALQNYMPIKINENIIKVSCDNQKKIKNSRINDKYNRMMQNKKQTIPKTYKINITNNRNNKYMY